MTIDLMYRRGSVVLLDIAEGHQRSRWRHARATSHRDDVVQHAGPVFIKRRNVAGSSRRAPFREGENDGHVSTHSVVLLGYMRHCKGSVKIDSQDLLGLVHRLKYVEKDNPSKHSRCRFAVVGDRLAAGDI